MRLEQVDRIIEKSAPFAQEILIHFRELAHRADDRIEEAIKWGMPFFTFNGKIVAHMAAFKNHAAIGFWKYDEAVPKGERNEEGMGHLGKLKSKSDLPADEVIIAIIQDAIEMSQKSFSKQSQNTKSKSKSELIVPDKLKEALAENDKAKTTFDNFSYSAQKEYIEWIRDAKTDITVMKRIKTTIENLMEGKDKNWKYRK